MACRHPVCGSNIKKVLHAPLRENSVSSRAERAFLHCFWGLQMSYKLARTLIDAYSWMGFVIGLHVQIQEFFHAPGHSLPRLSEYTILPSTKA
jgi:hypothetical protein